VQVNWYLQSFNYYDDISMDCSQQLLFVWDKRVDKVGVWVDAKREWLPGGLRALMLMHLLCNCIWMHNGTGLSACPLA
jgi:hypothetical protein